MPQALLNGGENKYKVDSSGSLSLPVSFCIYGLRGVKYKNTHVLCLLSFLLIDRGSLIHLNYGHHWIGELGSSNEMLLFALFNIPARQSICGELLLM